MPLLAGTACRAPGPPRYIQQRPGDSVGPDESRAGSPSYAPVAPADSRRGSRPKPLIATTATPIARAAQAAE